MSKMSLMQILIARLLKIILPFLNKHICLYMPRRDGKEDFSPFELGDHQFSL